MKAVPPRTGSFKPTTNQADVLKELAKGLVFVALIFLALLYNAMAG